MINPSELKRNFKRAFLLSLVIMAVYFMLWPPQNELPQECMNFFVHKADSLSTQYTATHADASRRRSVTPTAASAALDGNTNETFRSISNGSTTGQRHTRGPTSTATSRAYLASANRKCLQHLLDNDIVEYYYVPENDGNNLNFTTRGTTTKQRLSDETSKPLLVVCRTPRDLYDETILPRSICSPEVKLFMPNMMARDYDLARNLLKFFRHVAAVSGMEYYLNYGSLLGHIRFDKRPLPWDDDIDFSIDYSAINRFKRIFKRERKIYIGNITDSIEFLPQLHLSSDRLKIFDGVQTKQHNFPWTFPFLDLFFYSFPNVDFYDTEGEVAPSYYLEDAVMSSYSINISLHAMLPFRKEKFLGVEVTVPLNSTLFMNLTNYDRWTCRPLRWSHRYERWREGSDSNDIDCDRLKGFYDF